MRESLFETVTTGEFSDHIKHKMNGLRGRITSYAFDQIKKELISDYENSLDEDHVSHVDPSTGKCLCILRKAYRLPCRHRLKKYSGQIPLTAVHKRWHILYKNGRGN